jgi:hypothetical protein
MLIFKNLPTIQKTNEKVTKVLCKFFFLLAFCPNEKSQFQKDIKSLHFLGSEDNKNVDYTEWRV